jgi:hypothetical protein
MTSLPHCHPVMGLPQRPLLQQGGGVLHRRQDKATDTTPDASLVFAELARPHLSVPSTQGGRVIPAPGSVPYLQILWTGCPRFRCGALGPILPNRPGRCLAPAFAGWRCRLKRPGRKGAPRLCCGRSQPTSPHARSRRDHGPVDHSAGARAGGSTAIGDGMRLQRSFPFSSSPVSGLPLRYPMGPCTLTWRSSIHYGAIGLDPDKRAVTDAQTSPGPAD